MKYPPTITIAGKELVCEFTPTGNAVVLDDVTIDWGRDSLYEPTNPGELSLTLLDPTGAYGSDPGLYGSELILTTSRGMLFRGRIDGIKMTPDVIRWEDNATPPDGSWPAPPQNRDVWRVEITASDVLATLAKLIPPGPGVASGMDPYTYQQEYGQNMWPQKNTYDRRANLQSAVRAMGVAVTLQTRDFAAAVPAGKDWTQWYWEADIPMGDDAYTMLQRCQARGDEFFTANYIPAATQSQNRVGINRWPAAGALELVYANSVITVQGSAAALVNVIDCGTVYLDDEGTVSAAVDSNLGTLEIEELLMGVRSVPLATPNTFGQVIVWPSTRQTTTVSGGVTANRFVSPAQIGLRTLKAGDPSTANAESAAQFGARLAPIAAEVNGKLIPPALVFDIEANDYPAGAVQDLMATWTRPDGQPPAWAFPGSRYESLTGWGPFFQLIGGQLRFQQGWTHTARFAPSRGGVGSLAINQLVTSSTPTFDQYASTVSLATLGQVTKGI